jgi:hypothetical protein
MARYRQKDEVDLRWNKIRRRITRELDTQIAEWREEYLNELLSRAWDRYAAQLESGDVEELKPQFEQFVGVALSQVIAVEPGS